MDYKAAIEIAKQRMREIGKSPDDYHLEFVAVIGTAAERTAKLIQLKAFNQYYYLVDYHKYKGLYIFSDSGYFNSDDATNNTIQEFTGAVQIGQIPTKTWSIEVVDGYGAATLTPIDFIIATIF